MLQYKYKDIGVNMENEELVKMFNPYWKWERLIYFF